MDFLTAIKTCFSKYATFEGRARRSEFWYWFLFSFVLSLVLGFIPVVGWIVSLGLACPNIAVEIRRLHDTGRSGWWWFLNLVPFIGVIAVLIICATDSKPGTNEYGPNPKE